nr:MAG TPA: hypothetical protein [Caudoviricetes sp.]
MYGYIILYIILIVLATIIRVFYRIDIDYHSQPRVGLRIQRVPYVRPHI